LKEKTVTISFRVSESALRALQEDSKKQNVSLNTLANQMFVTYADYDRFLQKFHMVKLSTPTLKRIMNAATDDAIIEAGRSAGSSLPQSFMLAKTGETSVANALEYLRSMGAHANLFDYSEVVHEGKTSVTLSHDLGNKGTLFLTHYVESIFENLDKKLKVRELSDAIAFDV
jgi:histone H3/H4